MTTEEVLAAVSRFPSPEEKSGVLFVVDKAACDSAIAGLHRGGKEAVAVLIDKLVDTDPAADSKVRHAIHALVHYTCGLNDEKARAALAEALAAPLGGDKPKEIQAFLIHQVRLCGGKEVAAKHCATPPAPRSFRSRTGPPPSSATRWPTRKAK
jgi:hypothetical protein